MQKFLCLVSKGQVHLQHHRSIIDLQTITTKDNLENLENVFNTNRIIASKGSNVFVIKRKKRVIREILYENCGISITSKLWGASRKMGQLYVHRPVKKSKKQKITIGVEDHDWSSQDAYENEKKAIRLEKGIERCKTMKTNLSLIQLTHADQPKAQGVHPLARTARLPKPKIMWTFKRLTKFPAMEP